MKTCSLYKQNILFNPKYLNAVSFILNTGLIIVNLNCSNNIYIYMSDIFCGFENKISNLKVKIHDNRVHKQLKIKTTL